MGEKDIEPKVEPVKDVKTQSVELVHVTPEAEKLIAYCARVSSPNQQNPEYAKLLQYCISHGHWSIFEMASLCVEIRTTRAIAQQILRHRSFSFQEFSQRYAEVQEFVATKPRRQDTKNRQNSFDDLPEDALEYFEHCEYQIQDLAKTFYQEALDRGIAKESARFLLPLSTASRLYMHGNIRSWMHYLQVRCGPETQLEHREIAEQIKRIFIEQFPIIGEVLEWNL